MRRGSSRDAAALIRAIIATRDQQPRTAHDIAAVTDHDQLPQRVAVLLDRRAAAVQRRRAAYRQWHQEVQEMAAERQRFIDQHLSRGRDRGLDYGMEL